jgi:hypothetical protein
MFVKTTTRNTWWELGSGLRLATTPDVDPVTLFREGHRRHRTIARHVVCCRRAVSSGAVFAHPVSRSGMGYERAKLLVVESGYPSKVRSNSQVPVDQRSLVIQSI